MLAGFEILQPPPASHEELCSRLESTLLDISDLALPARLLKDAEALMGDWFAAERSTAQRSAAPALYRAIETLSRLTSIRRTLIALAKALMEPPRPPAPPKPAPPNPAKAAIAPESFSAIVPSSGDPASSLFVVPPSGGPGEGDKPSGCAPRETDPANTAPAQAVRPANLLKLSLTGALAPEPSPRSALSTPPLNAPAPSPGSAPSPTPQPKRDPLVRSSAEIVSPVRSCPRLATLSQKLLDPKINTVAGFQTALNPPQAAPKPAQPAFVPSRLALAYQKYSFHGLPANAGPAGASPAPPDSTAAPPNSS